MTAADYWDMFVHFATLSFLSVGGALSTSPEMHRYLVDGRGWLDHRQFVDSIALAQAAPGPNVLFVTLLGWQMAGLTGALVATVGIMLPSSVITWYANRLSNAHAEAPLVKAIRQGMSPIAIGLTASAGWLIARNTDTDWRLWAVTAVTFVVMVRTRINPLWLIAGGAALGGAGWL